MLFLLILSSALLYCEVNAKLDYFLEEARLRDMSNIYFNEDNCNIDTEEGEDGDTILISLDLIKDIPEETMVTFELLERGVDGNKDIGISLQEPLCNIIESKETMVAPILAAMNITGCPIRKGVYETEGYSLDEGQLPDAFPGGSYVAIVQVLLGTTVLNVIEVYARVP